MADGERTQILPRWGRWQPAGLTVGAVCLQCPHRLTSLGTSPRGGGFANA